jgi:hypothetical protein
MPRTANCPVFRLAKKQEGVVSYLQLRKLGVTEMGRTIRLQTGEWIGMLPSVLRLYWADETWMQRVWAASLWVGGRGCISHYTAAVLGGFAVASTETIDIISTKPMRVAPKWIAVHRVRRVLLETTQIAGGIRITSPVQTLIELAATLKELELEKLILEACRQRVVSLAQLREAIPRLTRRGKPGRGRLRRAVANLGNSSTDRSEIAA